jgi:hypothetical protein
MTVNLAFTAVTNVVAPGTITLNMPTGYFTGTAAFSAGATSVGAMTGSAPPVTTSRNQIIVTTASGVTGTGEFKVTLSDLYLNTADQATGVLALPPSA